MYYQNYDDYMRDLFYFNQMPNQNVGYPNMGFNMRNMNYYQNSGNQNLNNMYPSIYKIIQPVVSRIVTGNNYGYVTDDNLNSMVDTVYNIVEGDVSSSLIASDNDNNANQKVSNGAQSTTQVHNNSNSSNNNVVRNIENPQSNNLLKDLIRILLIKEIINRNNIRSFSNNMYNCQNYPNFYNERYMF